MSRTRCYYADAKNCYGKTWKCCTCEERFCQFHNHKTSLGENVECVACEGNRKQAQEQIEEERSMQVVGFEEPLPVPSKTYEYFDLPEFCHVEERFSQCGRATYYVAIVDGVEGVVEFQNKGEAWQAEVIKEMVSDSIARKKGHTCKINSKTIGVHYFADPNALTKFLRENYPKMTNVDVEMIVPITEPVVIRNGPNSFKALQPDPFA